MVKSNEFKGDNLAAAVRQATAAYVKQSCCELKSERRCNDLLLRMAILSSQATNYANEAERLRRTAERLKGDAAEELTFAAIAAIAGLAAVLLRIRRALKIIARMKKGSFSKDDLAELLTLVPTLAAAVAVVLASVKLREAQSLAREADVLAVRSESLGEQYMAAFSEYDLLGCGESDGFTGS